MLAERIGVSASTASESIRKLADQGLVHHEKYGAVTLTEAGRRAALAMVRRHRLMETFLVRMLGYSWDEVHDEAEVLEHAVSDRMLDRIDAKLGYPKRDPHGDPIPAADGHVPTPDARQLSVCEDGATGTVARISDADPEMLRYFDSVGITPGLAVDGAGPPRLRRHDLGGDQVGRRQGERSGHHRRPRQPGRRSDLGRRLAHTAAPAFVRREAEPARESVVERRRLGVQRRERGRRKPISRLDKRRLIAFLDHRLGPRDVSFEAKRFRHIAIASHQVAVGTIVAAGAGEQRAQPQQHDVAYRRGLIGQ